MDSCQMCLDNGYGTCTGTGVSSFQACTWIENPPTPTNTPTVANTPTPTNTPTPQPTPAFSGDYTMLQDVIFPSLTDADNPTRNIIGLDSGTGITNTAKLTIENDASLNLTSDKTLVVGSIQLNNGSIFIANGASIRIGSPIWVPDADADGRPTSATAKVASTQPSGLVRRNTITTTSLDCNDTSSLVYKTATCYTDEDRDTYTTSESPYTCIGKALDTTNSVTCNDATAGSIGSNEPAELTAGQIRSATNGFDCNENYSSVYKSLSCYTDGDNDTYTTGASSYTCFGKAGDTTNSVVCTDATSGSIGAEGVPTTVSYLKSAANGSDCDDAVNTRWQNSTCYYDGDNDGYRLTTSSTACVGSDCTSSSTAYKRESSAGLDCNDSNASQMDKCAFTSTGADQSYVVPAGISQISVKMWGAGGGGGDTNASALGGGGGYTTCTLNVTAGETLTIMAGSPGINNGQVKTYGGGGKASVGGSSGQGGSGGGRSAIRRSTTELMTAAGGGGGGGQSTDSTIAGNAGGGTTGQQKNPPCAGTQSAGGACSTAGGDGSAYTGGDAGSSGSVWGGGGGGAGRYGGEAGWSGSGWGTGGAGGSSYTGGCASGSTTSGSYATPGNSADSDRSGAGAGGAIGGGTGGTGRVVITLVAPAATPTPTTPTTPSPTSACTANGGGCSSDGACCSGICGTNADGDNYFSQAAGHTGTCQATSKLYTDCCDTDSRAYPGQTSCYSGTRTTCGGYDYNCSGGNDLCSYTSSSYSTEYGQAYRQCSGGVCWTDPENTYFTAYSCSGTSSCGSTGYSCSGSKPTSCSGACSFSEYKNDSVSSGTTTCK